jgi:site-specific DNA-cytosine methylase
MIPGSIDLLVAGTSCVDFSTLNSRKKGNIDTVEAGAELLKEWKEWNDSSAKSKKQSTKDEETEATPGPLRPDFFIDVTQWLNGLTPAGLQRGAKAMGQSSLTFMATVCYVNLHRPKIVILENVSGAPWDTICRFFFHAIDYEATYTRMDTKDYYIPQTRNRVYVVAVDRQIFGGSAKDIVQVWKDQLSQLERCASAPVQDWLLSPNDPLTVRARQDESEKAIANGLNPSKDVLWRRSFLRHTRVRRHYTLGQGRPLTAWGLGGIMRPYDRLDRLVLKNMNDRALDCVDICYLRYLSGQTAPQLVAPKAVDAEPEAQSVQYDIRFKTQIFDLSQNIDRTVDRGQQASCTFGVTGCLTPRGLNLITDQGRLVTGFEALNLQGLPLRDLDLTRESQDELRDLAGNAMTTTVVGAGLISLLIAIDIHGESVNPRPFGPITDRDDTMKQYEPMYQPLLPNPTHDEPRSAAQVPWGDVLGVIELSKRCRRYCYCNGGAKYSTDRLLRCRVCGVTRCKSCAGNPEHRFDICPPLNDPVMNDIIPREIMQHFPAALDSIIGATTSQIPFTEGSEHSPLQDSLICSLRSVTFYYTQVLVSETVTVCYSANTEDWCFNLQAVISDTMVIWYLFLDPWSRLGEQLCKYLGIPAAHMSHPFGRVCIQKDASECIPSHNAWEFWVFSKTSFDFDVTRPSPESIKVDILDLGSLPPATRNVLQSIEGTYFHHPECDAAENSLHVCEDQSRGTDGSEDTVRPKRYLFKDPTKFGAIQEDCYVITDDCKLLERHEFRDLLISLPPTWTPQASGVTVKAFIKGYWRIPDINTARLPCTVRGTSQAGSISVPSERQLEQNLQHHSTRTLASVHLSVKMPTDTYIILSKYMKSDPEYWALVSRSDYSALFELLAPVNVKLHGIEGTYAASSQVCESCSPKLPDTHWIERKKDPDSNTKALVREPYRLSDEVNQYKGKRELCDEPFQIAVNIKPRDPIVSQYSVTANYEVNIDMLAHRALSYLPDRKCDLRWDSRITTSVEIKIGSFNIPNLSFSPFRKSLRPLKEKPISASMKVPFTPGYTLTDKQQVSLSWMLSREQANCPQFTEREIEECTIQPLSTRAVGIAERRISRPGGILADDVGYGKTIISLALIGVQERFDQGQSKTMRTSQPLNTMALSASLVLAPKHLVQQWADEAKKFLGWKEPDIFVVRSSRALQGLLTKPVSDNGISLGRVKRQKVARETTTLLDALKMAKLIIVSTAVFDDNYYTWLAKYAGSFPHPQVIPRTSSMKDTTNPHVFGAFQDWYEDATWHAREHLSGYDPTNFNTCRLGAIAERRESLESSRAEVVADYRCTTTRFESQTACQDVKKKKKSGKGKGKHAQHECDERTKAKILSEADFESHNSVHVLEAFSFARIIYDEFSYENFCVAQFVKNADAHSKWILSATPPTGNLKAVCDIAQLLGVHVARPVKLRPGLPLITEGPIDLCQDSAEEQLSYGKLYTDKSVNERVEQGHNFLQHFTSANPFDKGGLGEISVIEKVYLSRMTRGELARYLDVQRDLRNPASDISGLPNRHNLDIKTGKDEIPLDGRLRAGLILAYVASVDCGIHYANLKSLLMHRERRLRTAQTELKRIADIAIWLVIRAYKEHGKKNQTATDIVEDLGSIFENILARDAVAFQGPDPLKAITESFFERSVIPQALLAWEMDETRSKTDYSSLFRLLDQQSSLPVWPTYFKLDATIIAGLDDSEVSDLLTESAMRGSFQSIAEEKTAEGKRNLLGELVKGTSAELDATIITDLDDSEVGNRLEEFTARATLLSILDQKPPKESRRLLEELANGISPANRAYPQLTARRRIRGGNYTQTESELTDVMLQVNDAIDEVGIQARQVRAAISLLCEAHFRKCDVCENHQGKLLFLAECGHFICESHERDVFCGHVKSRKYPNGSGCSALIPERTIPLDQIDLCRPDIFDGPVNKLPPKASSKSRTIYNTILSIWQRSNDHVLVFYQFDQQRDEICGMLDRASMPYKASPTASSNEYEPVQRSGTGVPGKGFADSDDKKLVRIEFMKISSIEAAGKNMQYANHVMFVSTPVFAKQEDFEKYVTQAKGRAIRHGQKKNVYVYYFVCANTFEVDLLQLRTKSRLQLDNEHAASLAAKVGEAHSAADMEELSVTADIVGATSNDLREGDVSVADAAASSSVALTSALSAEEVWKLTDETNWLVQQNREF